MLKLGYWQAGWRWNEGNLEAWIRANCPALMPALGFSAFDEPASVDGTGMGGGKVYWPQQTWAMWQAQAQGGKKEEVRRRMVHALDLAYGGKEARAYSKATEAAYSNTYYGQELQSAPAQRQVSTSPPVYTGPPQYAQHLVAQLQRMEIR